MIPEASRVCASEKSKKKLQVAALAYKDSRK